MILVIVLLVVVLLTMIVPLYTSSNVMPPGIGTGTMNAIHLETELVLAVIEVDPSADEGIEFADVAGFLRGAQRAAQGFVFRPPGCALDAGHLLLPAEGMTSANPDQWRVVMELRANELSDPTLLTLSATVAMPNGVAGRPDLYTIENFTRTWVRNRVAVEAAILAGAANLPPNLRLVLPTGGAPAGGAAPSEDMPPATGGAAVRPARRTTRKKSRRRPG